jgi:RHS repeat-associated protein
LSRAACTTNSGASCTATFTVTRDAQDPLASLSATTSADGTSIDLGWNASDAGAGLATCALEVREDAGAWQPYSLTCSGTGAYAAQPGHTYTFRLSATDNVGNEAQTEEGAFTTAVTKYYYFGGQRVAMRNPDGVYYLHADHLGSTSLTTDESGTVVARQLYYPYGSVRWSEGILPTDFGFTGQRAVPGSGLIFMHARYYHPYVGRFIQADTIVPEPGDPQSLNRFAYVTNNPLKFIDPSGHAECVDDNCTRTIHPVSGRVMQHDRASFNPWSFYEDMMDRNGDGVVTPREIQYFQSRVWRDFVTRMEMPVAGFVPNPATDRSAFGGPNTLQGPGRHAAIDIGGSRGTLLYAVAYGVVVDTINNPNLDLGRVVVVEHNVYEVKFYAVYAHLQRIDVSVGDVVDSRTRVGTMGDSGTASVHLHFEVRTAMNVNLDAQGNYQSFPRSADSYWADTESELKQKWVDLGPIFGYFSGYPWTRYSFSSLIRPGTAFSPPQQSNQLRPRRR